MSPQRNIKTIERNIQSTGRHGYHGKNSRFARHQRDVSGRGPKKLCGMGISDRRNIHRFIDYDHKKWRAIHKRAIARARDVKYEME